MDIRGKRFLVIGGAGFIGSHTVDEILKEDVAEVRIYDNFSSGREQNVSDALRDPRATIFQLGGDILHRDILDAAMKDIDGVFHFAGLWLMHCYDYPRSAFEVNIAGTFNVLEAMTNNLARRLVYSSSASVYGDPIFEPMSEDHPHGNRTFYGATKIAGEHMCRALFHRYKSTGKRFDYVGLRYMNVYGPRQSDVGEYISVVMKMLNRIDAGLPPIIYGDGSQGYDFVYVRDCAVANVLAMKADASDSFYNVGTGKKTTVRDLAYQLLRASRSSLDVVYDAASTSLVKSRVGCPEKAGRELGFRSTVDLPEGIKRLVEWRTRNSERHP